MVCTLRLFRRVSAAVTAVRQARKTADSAASRSIGPMPDITNAAIWDTVGNAQLSHRAYHLCMNSHACMKLSCLVARVHIGAAYIRVDVITLTSNLRPGCLGPPVFAITV